MSAQNARAVAAASTESRGAETLAIPASGRIEMTGLRAAEFFAGMGLMRAGLDRAGVATAYANDVDETKADLYRDNWGGGELDVCDVRSLRGEDIPDVDLATASFPCTDLSLAGHRRGLAGAESGLVFEFLRVVEEMGDRAPHVLMLENVPGLLTANGGRDWRMLMTRLDGLGYASDHVCVDAGAFVAQSRRRVFVVARRGASFSLPSPPPSRDDLRLSDVVDRRSEWWAAPRLGKFLSSMSPLQRARVEEYRAWPRLGYFGAFRRTRNGRPVWEVRADEIAGALRTTRGGSAKQAVLRAGRGKVAARWMSVSEYARLQGAGDLRYGAVTPQQAMFALGDAVCVPVVEWLARHCLLPLMAR